MLYFAQSLDNLLLANLNNIAIDISTIDDKTLFHIKYILNYVTTFPKPIILFKKLNIKLKAHSDVSYLCTPRARSRGVGYIFLGEECLHNGSIQVLCKLLKVVVSSATEAELAALYITCKQCIPLCQALIKLGHHQPPTLLITNNETTTNLCNNILKQKHSKSIDIRFYFMKDRVHQKECTIM